MLARLLSPADFGLMAIAFVAILFLEAISTTGIHHALIQRREAPETLFDTAWTAGLLRSGFIATCLVATAPMLGHLFGAPAAVPVLRAMALFALLQGLTNVAIAMLNRNLMFGRYYVLQISGIVADLCVAVPLAFWLGTVWALVWGAIAHAAARVVVSFLVHPYRPRIRLDRDELRELYRYGRWVTISSALEWALTEGVHGATGYLLGVRVLGVYRVAWRIASVPVGQIAEPVARVTIGAYARLQDSPDRIDRAYRRVTAATALVVWPAAVAIVLYAAPIVRVLLGERWLDAVDVVQILALAGLLRSATGTWRSLFQGIGRPEAHASAAAGELAVVLALLWPLTREFGALGPAMAVAIGGAAGVVLAVAMLSRTIRIAPRMIVMPIVMPGLACIPWVVASSWWSTHVETAVGLVAHLGMAAVVYLATLYAMHRVGVYRVDPTVFQAMR